MSAVVILATVRPQAGRTDEVLEILREVVAQVHEEPGCVYYTLNRADDGSIHFIEKWESAEHADRHAAQSPVMPVLAERTSPLLQGPPEVLRLTPVPAGDPQKGAL